MPTPPLRRRNPAVSIRRVQSERKYLTPWGSTPAQLTWKYKYDYARRTAIIPPMGSQPHMIGTSQGVLVRGNPLQSCYRVPPPRSEAYLQPLPLVAPPLIIGVYPAPRGELPEPPRIPMTEEEFLAQERLTSFLTGATTPHKPRSLLSYPESHLYESLISRVSDITKDDISIGDPDEDSLYQKISIRDSGGETSLSSEVTSSSGGEGNSGPQKAKSESTREEETQKAKSESTREERTRDTSSTTYNSSSNVIVRSNQKVCFDHVNSKARAEVDGTKKCPLGKWTRNFCTFEDIENEEGKNPPKANDENTGKRYMKKLSFRQSFTNYTNKNNSKNYLKSIFKKRKKSDKLENEPSPPHTVVSVVHVNNKNDVDEVSLLKSNCCKFSEYSFSNSYFEKCFSTSHSKKPNAFIEPTEMSQGFDVPKRQNIFRVKSITKERIQSRSSVSSNPENSYCQQMPVIPTTVELPESISRQNYFLPEKAYGNDKGVQVSSEDITRSQNDYKEVATFGSLRPAASTPDFTVINCKNCQKQQQQLQQRDQRLSSKNKPVRHSQSMKMDRLQYFQTLGQTPRSDSSLFFLKRSTDKKSHGSKTANLVVPLATTDDGSESTGSQKTDKAVILSKTSTNFKKKAENGEEGSQNASLSNFQFYSINSRNPDSFVYVYQFPKSSNKSSALSSLDYRDEVYIKRHSHISVQTKQNRRGGSSGLGSSGSDSSFEDDYQEEGVAIAGEVPAAAPSSARKKTSSASAFADPATSCCYSYSSSSLQYAGCDSPLSSLSSLKSDRGRLFFDYSWSWSRLNDLVRRSPSASSADRRMTSTFAGLASIRVP